MRERGMLHFIPQEAVSRLLTTSQTGRGDCDSPVWISPSKNVRMEPPENTVVVVVDIRSNQGAIYIVNKQTDGYVDHVGTDVAGNLIMVPWNKDWWYYCLGSTRLAYIGNKS